MPYPKQLGDAVPLLVLAARAGRADLVALLLEYGARADKAAIELAILYVTDDEYQEVPSTNALAVTARKACRDIVELLLKVGAKARAEVGSTTPLKEAEIGGHKGIIKLLKTRME